MRVDIHLKKHDICMGLDLPDLTTPSLDKGGDWPEPPQDAAAGSFNAILMNHIDFKACIQPEVPHDDAFYKQCAAEVDAIRLFFPGLHSEPILISFSAWLGFACAMDDTLETLSPAVGEAVLRECIWIMTSRTREFKAPVIDKRIQHMALALRDHCSRNLTPQSAAAFFKAVSGVFEAHIDETWFLRGSIPQDLPTYMSIRCRTISLNPFFEVIKTEYLPSDQLSNPVWHKLQHAVSCAAGLQNDLIGLERDIEKGEELNAVIVLMRPHGADPGADDEAFFEKQVNLINEEHNINVARALDLAAKATRLANGIEAFAVAEVVQHITLLASTHLMWCASAKRYQTEVKEESA